MSGLTPAFAVKFTAALTAWIARELWHGFKKGRTR